MHTGVSYVSIYLSSSTSLIYCVYAYSIILNLVALTQQTLKLLSVNSVLVQFSHILTPDQPKHSALPAVVLSFLYGLAQVKPFIKHDQIQAEN